MIQLSHTSNPFTEEKFPLVLILDDVSGPANIGSIFRLADAFNIEKLVLCGPEIDLSSNRLKRTARSTISSVSFEQSESSLSVCREYAHKGYTMLALEITEDSLALDSVDYSEYSKVALVLGNEASGISEQVLELVDRKIHIRMFGKNSSMNVAQATGIALFEITKTLSPV